MKIIAKVTEIVTAKLTIFCNKVIKSHILQLTPLVLPGPQGTRIVLVDSALAKLTIENEKIKAMSKNVRVLRCFIRVFILSSVLFPERSKAESKDYYLFHSSLINFSFLMRLSEEQNEI